MLGPRLEKFFENIFFFALKSEIHISEEYGTIIKLYCFSHMAVERVKSNGSLRFKAK